MYDLGQATANIMLAATDLGIGSGHAAASDQEQARRVLGFPTATSAYLIALGTGTGGNGYIAAVGVVKMSDRDSRRGEDRRSAT
jgi:hypothetical protein